MVREHTGCDKTDISVFNNISYTAVHYLFTQSYTALGWLHVVETCKWVRILISVMLDG